MRSLGYELAIALSIMAAVTGLYALTLRHGLPAPVSAVGQLLGISGFVLMLATETLYSLRKHLRRFHAGRMSTWLHAHVVTGLVGSYLIMLHSAGKYHGLAGVALLLTAVAVLSGFIGRYLYTSVPRTLDGNELGVQELLQRSALAEQQLQELGLDVFTLPALAELVEPPDSGLDILWGGLYLIRWRHRRQVRLAMITLQLDRSPQAPRIEALLNDCFLLHLKIRNLAAARRLLALWHVFHVPLSVALLMLATIHICAAIYYAHG